MTGPARTGETGMRRPVRIANCSGFYGDRASAAREMAEGGPIDVLTGDYLAELTMLILWKARQKDPAAGYARTFLGQFEEVIGTCLDRGITIVVNAGGLNPAGLAARLREIAGGSAWRRRSPMSRATICWAASASWPRPGTRWRTPRPASRWPRRESRR